MQNEKCIGISICQYLSRATGHVIENVPFLSLSESFSSPRMKDWTIVRNLLYSITQETEETQMYACAVRGIRQEVEERKRFKTAWPER
jgi:hypothetical protein